MSTINEVIADLKARLRGEIDEAEYYQRQLQRRESSIIKLKTMIADLESMQHG